MASSIVLIIIGILGCVLFFNSFLIKGCNTISKKGLKPTLTRIWEGDPNYK